MLHKKNMIMRLMYGINSTWKHSEIIYLKTDVLLLTDIFENFRKLCLNYYKLDPVHYFGTPGIAWDACLKMSGQTLELVTDPDIYLFIERAKRGGMSL